MLYVITPPKLSNMAAVHIYGVFLLFTISICPLEGADPPPFINTEPIVTGWKGDDALLPCNFSGEPSAVSWAKLSGTDLSTKDKKAEFSNGTFRSFDKRFEMDDDFTLHIRELQVSDEGEYLCLLERKDQSYDDKATYLSVNGFKLSAGAIVGITIAAIILPVLLIVCVVCTLRKRMKR